MVGGLYCLIDWGGWWVGWGVVGGLYCLIDCAAVQRHATRRRDIASVRRRTRSWPSRWAALAMYVCVCVCECVCVLVVGAGCGLGWVCVFVGGCGLVGGWVWLGCECVSQVRWCVDGVDGV